MTKADFLKYEPGTPEYIVMHGRYKARKGRKPSATGWFTRNPRMALKKAEVFANFPKTVTFQQAKEVAQIFKRIEEVQAIEVFGSVARVKEGNDLDLILICDEETCERFFAMVELDAVMINPMRRCFYNGLALTRWDMAEILLDSYGDDEEGVFANAYACSGVPIDIFLFPPNWRERLTDLQQRLHHHDEQFMEKIAKDARAIA